MSARRPLAMLRATSLSFARWPPTTLETALRPQSSRYRTPQLLNSPSSCRLHRRVLRRDAHGRRHSVRQLRRGDDGVQRDDSGDAANASVRRTFTTTDDAETALPPRRPSRYRTPRLLNSPSSLPTTPSSAPTRCPWTTPRRLTTAASDDRVSADDRWRCCRQLHHRSHVHGHRRRQLFDHADHHGTGHHSS